MELGSGPNIMNHGDLESNGTDNVISKTDIKAAQKNLCHFELSQAPWRPGGQIAFMPMKQHDCQKGPLGRKCNVTLWLN